MDEMLGHSFEFSSDDVALDSYSANRGQLILSEPFEMNMMNIVAHSV